VEARRRPSSRPVELPGIARWLQAISDGMRTADGLNSGVTTPTLEPDLICGATTLLNTVLGIKYTRVTGAEFTQDGWSATSSRRRRSPLRRVRSPGEEGK
jgi:hypothetical protein